MQGGRPWLPLIALPLHLGVPRQWLVSDVGLWQLAEAPRVQDFRVSGGRSLNVPFFPSKMPQEVSALTLGLAAGSLGDLSKGGQNSNERHAAHLLLHGHLLHHCHPRGLSSAEFLGLKC